MLMHPAQTPVIIRVRDPARLDYEDPAARQFKFDVVATTAAGKQVSYI